MQVHLPIMTLSCYIQLLHTLKSLRRVFYFIENPNVILDCIVIFNLAMIHSLTVIGYLWFMQESYVILCIIEKYLQE